MKRTFERDGHQQPDARAEKQMKFFFDVVSVLIWEILRGWYAESLINGWKSRRACLFVYELTCILLLSFMDLGRCAAHWGKWPLLSARKERAVCTQARARSQRSSIFASLINAFPRQPVSWHARGELHGRHSRSLFVGCSLQWADESNFHKIMLNLCWI